MPATIPGAIVHKGDTVTVHVTGAASHPEIHANAVQGIARAIEAQGYLTLRSVTTEPNGATIRYTVVKNPLPLLLGLVAFLAGGLATAGTAYTIDSAVGSGPNTMSTVSGGLFSFSGSTYILVGLALGFFVVTRARG